MAITFKVGFQVDDKDLKAGLAGIQNDIKNAFNIKGNMSEEIANATQQAMILEKALKRATTDKGISFYSLNSELRKAGSSATQLISTLTAGGDRFAASLNAANAAFATANRNVISLNSKIQEMARVLTQSFKFTTAQAFLQGVSNAAREAYQWVYDLNKTITDISVVTGYQGEALDKVTQNAIAGARELRIAANEYAEGALIFYQQGLGDDEVARRVEITAKAARAAGSSLDEMSSQLTAIWNTYHMAGDEMERAASVGARMAADTAVDFADIAEAMQTAAAPAEQMGVSYNSLAAIIATVGDTTQQSASVIGNAFKTIFSRFQQLRSEGTDGEVTLGAVSQQLQELGVNVLDAGGQLKSLDTVIAEVGNQWDDWSSKQQLAIAQLVGGTRQYGQFLTLMNNFDKYQDLLSSANLEDGSTLTQQYEASLDSIESRAENAAEAMNRAFSNLIDEDMLKGALGLVEDFGNVLGSLLESLNGIQGVGLIIAGIFNKQITQGIRNATANLRELWSNRNATGRAKNINRDYDTMESDVNAQMQANQGNSAAMVNLNAQKQKLQYDRQIAIVNNEINTLMDKANGKFKIQLQQQQTYLTSLQQRRTAAIDELATLERQAEVSRQLSEQEQRRLQLALQRAQAEEADAQEEYDSVTAKLNGTDGGPAIKNRRNDDPEKQALLAQQAAASQKITQAQAKQIIIQEQLTQGTNDYDMAMQKLVKETASLINSGQKSDTIMAKVKTTFANLKGELKLSDSQIDSLTQSLDQLEQNFTPEKLAQFVAKIAEMGDTSKETTADIERLTSAAQEIQTTTNAMDDYQGRERTYDDESGPIQTPTPPEMNFEVDYASAFQNGTQAAMAFAGTLTTVIGASQMLMSVWSDEDASMSEKIMALVSALGMAIPTLTMAKDGLGSFKQMVLDLNPELAKLVTQQATATAATTGMSAAQQGVTATAGAMGTATTAAGAAATTAGTAGAAAGTSMAAAWAAALWPIVAIIAAVAAVGAAVAFVAGEIKNSSPEAQFERASEAAENLATAAEEAQTAAENLASTIEGYNSAVDTLNDCVRGTEEWEEALKAANDAAVELINNLPSDADLSGLYSRNAETGLIEFDQNRLSEIQEEADIAASNAQYTAQNAQIQAQQAGNRVTQNNISGDLSEATGYFIDPNTGQKFGQSVSEVNKILEENIGELSQTLDADEFKAKLEQLGVEVQGSAEDLEPLRQQCIDLAESMDNAAAKADLYAQSQVDAMLGDDYTAEVKQIAGESLQAATDAYTDEFLNSLTNKNGGNMYGNIAQIDTSNAALLTDINNLLGGGYSWQSNGIQGTDNNRTFHLLKDGKEEDYSAEQLAAKMGAAKALEEVAGSAENAAQALSMVKTGSEDFNKFITNKNFNSMTEGELTSNFGEDMVATEDEARTYLETIFGSEEELNEAAELMGKSVDDLIQEVIDGTEVSASAVQNMGDNLGKRAKAIFDKADLSGVEVEAQKNYSLMMEKAFTAGGSEGGEYLNTFIESLQGEAAEAGVEMTDVFDELSGIDWSHITPDQLAEKLNSLGISTDDLIDQMPELIELMNQAASVDFSTAQQHFKDLQSFMTMGAGEVISQGDYDKISAEGQEYFQLMADGTYQLIGDAREFQNLMKNEAMAQYDQVAFNNQQRLDQIASIQANAGAYDYNELSKSQWGISINNPLGALGKDNETTRRQLEYLKASGWADENQAQMREWSKGLENNDLDIFEYSQIANAIRECGDQTENWTEKTRQLNEEQKKIEEMQDATRIQGDMEESGTSWEDLEAYRAGIKQTIDEQEDMAESSKDFSDALLDNEQTLNEVAKEQARFTDGLQTAGDNMEDWKDIWDDSGTIKDYQKFSDSMEDMRDAYSDLLDVDGSSLSEDFLASADNMELLETVLTGSAEEAAEALAQLQEKAIIDLDLDMDTPELQKNIGIVQDQLAGLAAGTEITPTVDNTEFFNALNAMIAACGTDMAKIEALCNNLNIEPLTSADLIPNEIGADVEADTTTVESEGKNEATSYDVQPGGTQTFDVEMTDGPADIDIGGGTLATVSVPTWDYVPKKETEETTQETPVTSFKIKPGTGITTTSSNKTRVNRATPPTPDSYRGGSTKPKSNGGGGGGSKPKHSAKKASKYEPIKDRYATVKSSIDEVQRSVDALSDAQDDAWGAAKVRNLQKINSELQKQGKNLQQLRKLSLDYLKTDKRDAQIAAKDLITNLTKEGLPGLNLDQVLFNGEGFVSNRTELTAQLDNYLKSLYEPYYQAAMAYDRANSTNEAESERIDALKEKYDVAKAFVDEFLAALDLVDETAQEAADALEQQLENIREWMANKVEEATYKMEFQIGINERDISLIEQAIELWGDLGTMMGKTFDQLGKQLREETENFNLTLEHGNRMIEIINNINPSNANRDWFIGEFGEEAWNKYITGNGGLPAEVLEAMQNDADSMIEYMNSMYDIAEEMFGQYIEVLNMYMDEFDKIADKISANNDRLEMFAELLEFSGKKWTSDGRDAIRSIADATVDNAQLEVERAASALELAKQGAEETTAQLEEFYAEHGRDAEGYNDTEAFVYNQLKAAKDEADQLLADAQSDMTSSIQDLASAAADAIEMVAEVIKDEVVENLGGDFASFDDMTSMYDQQYDLDTFFLRDFDKEYQLNSLLGDIDDQMENITDPGRLKEYEALIEEINAANQEGVDLTQTDVDLLKAKFEIQKAQDAYEEAQNAKNTMRLARDASGNWNYVYSSDQSETDDAAQALADAQYNYEKLLWEASDEASQYWLQAQQEFFQFQETIDWARYEHDADYKRMIDQQLAYYQQKTELYANQIVKYNGMLDVAFEDTTLGVITNCKDMNSAQEWYTTQHTKYTNDLKQNTKDYQGQVEETCNQVGIKYDELEETVKTETELMGKENDALREKIKTLNTEGSRALSKLDDKVRNFRENFIQHMEACQRKLEAFLKTLKQMENASINEMYNTGFDAGTDYTAEIHNYIGQKLEEGYTEEQLLADEGLKSLVTELKNKLGSEELYYAGHGTVKDRWGQQGWDFVDKYLQSAVDEAMDYFLSGNFEIWDTVDEWVRDHPNWRELAQQNWGKPPETATGGLIRTPQIRSVAEDGAELILNSEDTKNILSAVAHMRDIVRMKMSSINGTLGKQTSSVVNKTIVNKDIQQVEQQVHIDATFPNVSVASEIEEAFSNLVNQAVQYVSQKNHQ